MDSENLVRRDQASQAGTRQDTARHAATPIGRNTPLPVETVDPIDSPHFVQSATDSVAQSTDIPHQQDRLSVPGERQIVSPVPKQPASPPKMSMPPTTNAPVVSHSLPDDEPVTVPVLGAQPSASHWEEILARIEDIGHDNQTDALNPSDEDDIYDAPELDAAGDMVDALSFAHHDPFAFHERSWEGWRRYRKTALILLTLALMLAVAVVGAVAAVSAARRATQNLTLTPPTPTTSSYSGGVVVQPGPDTLAPTPEAPKYQIGAWVSSNSPTGGNVKVFVRLSHNVAPVAHVPVTLVVQIPAGTLRFGPVKTDAYGLAIFPVNYGGVTGAPVFVSAYATLGGQGLEADTFFVPV